jgi:serine acetyltransferase
VQVPNKFDTGFVLSGESAYASLQDLVHSCSVCHQVNTLSVQQIFPSNNRTLVNKLLLTAEQASVLRNIEMSQRAALGANAVPASAK